MLQYFKSSGLVCVITIAFLATVSCTGGGETVISGLGNSGNYIGKDDEIAMLANALASQTVVPRVSDEEIVKLYTNVQEKARGGDFKASVVILRLAAYQRKIEAEAAD
jgi:hypothetical protein